MKQRMPKDIRKVSVIILNYNGKRFIEKLFNSLAEQTFKNFDVIFVDNGSKDNSVTVLRDLLGKEPLSKLRVKIVSNRTNLGYCKGNNTGLKYTSGDCIVFLNNDTFVAKTWLEELVNAMNTYPSVVVCQSRLLNPISKVQADGCFLDKYGHNQGIIIRRNDLEVSRIPFYVSGASMLVRASALNRIGGFDPEIFYGDFDLCWRLRLLGYDMAVALRSICYHYGGGTMKTLVPLPKLIFYRDSEIVRVFLKCYSIMSLMKRLPSFIVMMFIEATHRSYEKKNPLYLLSSFKALHRNLRILKNTVTARQKIQGFRKIPDRGIEDRMAHYSVLLTRMWTVEII